MVVDGRTYRFQLYDEATALGLPPRRGGYTINFLETWLEANRWAEEDQEIEEEIEDEDWWVWEDEEDNDTILYEFDPLNVSNADWDEFLGWLREDAILEQGGSAFKRLIEIRQILKPHRNDDIYLDRFLDTKSAIAEAEWTKKSRGRGGAYHRYKQRTTKAERDERRKRRRAKRIAGESYRHA